MILSEKLKSWKASNISFLSKTSRTSCNPKHKVQDLSYLQGEIWGWNRSTQSLPRTWFLVLPFLKVVGVFSNSPFHVDFPSIKWGSQFNSPPYIAHQVYLPCCHSHYIVDPLLLWLANWTAVALLQLTSLFFSSFWFISWEFPLFSLEPIVFSEYICDCWSHIAQWFLWWYTLSCFSNLFCEISFFQVSASHIVSLGHHILNKYHSSLCVFTSGAIYLHVIFTVL